MDTRRSHIPAERTAAERLERVSAPRTATDLLNTDTIWEKVTHSLILPPSLILHPSLIHPQKKLDLTLTTFSRRVSSVALYPVAQELDPGSSGWDVRSKSDSTRGLQICALAGKKKLFAVFETTKEVQARPRTGRSQVSVQSTLTSKEKIVTLTKLQRVYYQLCLDAISRETGV